MSGHCGGSGPTSGPTRSASASSRSLRCCRSRAQLTIPLIVKAAIDGPITRRRQAAASCRCSCSRWVSAVFELALTYRRRLLARARRDQLETELRDDFYAHLQRLEVGFHDRWQSGQLLSRANSDISLIRRFVGVRRGLLRDHRDRGDRDLRVAARASTCGSALLTIATAIPVLAAVPAVRAQLPRGRARHPGPDRRPHDDDRGSGPRHPRDQGVRPRPTRCSRRYDAQCRELHDDRARARPHPHAVHLGARAHPEPHAHGGAARRRARGVGPAA